jgi:hypothetical protein
MTGKPIFSWQDIDRRPIDPPANVDSFRVGLREFGAGLVVVFRRSTAERWTVVLAGLMTVGTGSDLVNTLDVADHVRRTLQGSGLPVD